MDRPFCGRGTDTPGFLRADSAGFRCALPHLWTGTAAGDGEDVRPTRGIGASRGRQDGSDEGESHRISKGPPWPSFRRERAVDASARHREHDSSAQQGRRAPRPHPRVLVEYGRAPRRNHVRGQLGSGIAAERRRHRRDGEHELSRPGESVITSSRLRMAATCSRSIG